MKDASPVCLPVWPAVTTSYGHVHKGMITCLKFLLRGDGMLLPSLALSNSSQLIRALFVEAGCKFMPVSNCAGITPVVVCGVV